MIVCLCHNINHKAIDELIKRNKSLEEIVATCGAGSGCGACIKSIQKEINEYRNSMSDIFDMFGNLKGLSVERAKELVPSSYDIRIVEDGEPITLEYRPERLNLFIKDGIVQDVSRG